uniref:Reverse transcriptase domain-containing protein n=1 Tax=Tanacetum cinerariifolium TaxID=118510 RepID=A0A6L2J9K6_TANCI|nr:reverse transcriptase domain-containing protein [Tanacetum cinerariifolium]
MRNTLGKEQIPQDLDRPTSDAALREYCDGNYHKLLPIIAEKVHQEKVQKEKIKVIKAHLNFEKVSQHSESGTLSRRRDLKKRLGSGQVRSMTGSPKPRRGRSESPRKKDSERRTVFKRLKNGVFHRLGDKEKSMSAYSNDSRRRSYHSGRGDAESCYLSSRSKKTEFASEKHHNKRASSRRLEPLSRSEDSVGGHWKSKPKQQKSSIEDDLSRPKNASKFRSKFITSSREMRNLRNSLCGVDEMMRVTTAFLRGEVAASSRKRKKSLPLWKQQEAG